MDSVSFISFQAFLLWFSELTLAWFQRKKYENFVQEMNCYQDISYRNISNSIFEVFSNVY